MNRPIKNALLTLFMVIMLALSVQAQPLPTSHSFLSQRCAACHANNSATLTAAKNNICLTCHKSGSPYTTNKQFFSGDMANPFGTTIDPAAKDSYTHSSHEWSAADDNPAAGALPPVDYQMMRIKEYNGSLSCNRCHWMHNDKPMNKLVKETMVGDQMCLDCHRLRNTNTHATGSHPVNVDYATVAASNPGKFAPTPINSNPANRSSNLGAALSAGKVVCSTCHAPHFADSSSKTLDNFSTAYMNGLLPSKGYLLKTDYRFINYTAVDSPNICNNCHIGKHEHNGKGQRIRCTDCHSGHVDYDANALDPKSRVPNIYLVKRYMNWSSSTGWKDNKTIPKQTFFRYTTENSDPKVTYYRRADGKGVCQGCHAVPTTIADHQTTEGLQGKATYCNGCHNHSNSFSSGCTTCHAQPPVSPETAAKDYPRASLEASSGHAKHAAGDENYRFACAKCHPPTSAGRHVDGNFQTVFGAGWVDDGTNNGRIPGYDPITYTCSNIYCHSNGAPAGTEPYVTKLSPAWFTKNANGCSACHDASPVTNAHDKHIANGFACENCHAATVSGSTIIDLSKHANHEKDVKFSSIGLKIDIAAGTKQNTTCTVACHRVGAPDWTIPASGACGTCHATTNNISGAHEAHLANTKAYGPYLNQLPLNQNGAPSSCDLCHGPDYRTNHLDGTTTVVNSNCTSSCHRNGLGTATWTTGRAGVTCESCHTGLVSIVNGATAPNKSLAATKGHNMTTSSSGVAMGYSCTTCHDQNAAHINPSVHDTRLQSTYAVQPPNTNGAVNNECNVCHNNTTKVPTATKSNMLTHITDYIGTSATANTKASACTSCHDLHGSSNKSMIREKIVFNSITCNITYSDSTQLVSSNKVNNLYTGLCQVCHTKTRFYTNSQLETQHYTSGCLGCHNHKPAGKVYAFQPFGTCDACHGYPPVEKVVAGMGVLGHYSGARLQNYSGGGGAHAVLGHISDQSRPSQEFANCLTCHYGSDTNGLHTKGYLTKPSTINVKVDPKYKFDSKLDITYSGNKSDDRSAYRTGSCSNVSCHFQPTPNWSSQKQ